MTGNSINSNGDAMPRALRSIRWSRLFPLFLVLLFGHRAIAAPIQSLTLMQAEEMWRRANFELRIARLAVTAASGDVQAADRRANPVFTMSSVSINPRSGLGAGGLRDKNADSTLRLEQVLERGDKRGHRTRNAQARLQAAERDADDTERIGLVQLRIAYWDLKLAEERERLTAVSAALAAEALTAAGKRQSAGDLAAADVARLKVDLLKTDSDARAAAADRKKACLALAVLINVVDDADRLEIADSWPATIDLPASAGNFASGRADEIGNRPDVRAAEARVAAAEAAVHGSRALGKRDVTFGLQFEHFPSIGDQAPNNTWGISISIPLFASHTHDGEIVRANAELDQAREQLQRARAIALAEVGRARADMGAAAGRIRQMERELLPAAETVAKAAEFAFARGAAGLIDVLDARRTLRQTLLDAAAARADHAKALAAIRMLALDPPAITAQSDAQNSIVSPATTAFQPGSR
jgi:cobalt-zinc-cadmium efflux system outer membrane protein